MTGVSECSQQRGNLKDNRYKPINNKVPTFWLALCIIMDYIKDGLISIFTTTKFYQLNIHNFPTHYFSPSN
ncbi:hypothetical protein [Photorhabdus bodei]|uniref:Uncharacterized protein n=1 Tax=Photorhabdus bodei TaxID=2029681 RepID=A0ABX0APN1_9GAMM|nr:hypothetical protein [Photorhabdus bodei]NDK99525.1 hypothetical protein [Photorhabdus bodei]NDL03853.1 hypothetical protein [Photorhabdus bodei]NDL07904.1 hypothetical protein [Photorhabdus bodei]